MSRSQAKKARSPQGQRRAAARGIAASVAKSAQAVAQHDPASQATGDAGLSSLPMVSVCTVTRNRSHLLPLLETCILNQTYPRHLIEWVIVDDSDPGRERFRPNPDTGLKTRLAQIEQKLLLGKKRNLSHTFCQGEVIVYMDDDEYYPPRRIEHAVESLQASGRELAGATNLPILFIPERELWMAGPYGDYHATANTFAFKRSLLNKTQYEDSAIRSEEKAFLQNYTLPMVQLDPKQTIVCFGHSNNTFDKRRLIGDGKNPLMQPISAARMGEWIESELLDQYVQAHRSHQRSTPAPPVWVADQSASKEKLLLLCSPKGSGDHLVAEILTKLGVRAIVGQGKIEDVLSTQLLKPNGTELRGSPEQTRQALQQLNQQLLAQQRQVADRPFLIRDPRAAFLLYELASSLDVRLITCLRPLTAIADDRPSDPNASSQAHRLYGQIFSVITNSRIPFQLIRHHDLISHDAATLNHLIQFCGIKLSDQQRAKLAKPGAAQAAS